MKLTQRLIDSFAFEGKTPNAADVRWDDVLPNFGVRVFPSGAKSFVIRPTIDGRYRYKTLGPTTVLGLAQARDLARVKLADALQGRDPLAGDPRGHRGALVADLVREFLDRHVHPKLKSCPDVEQKLNAYVLPVLGRRPVEHVTPQDVSRLLHRVGEKGFERTVKRKGKLVTLPAGGRICANRVHAILSKMFNVSRSLIGVDMGGAKNPTEGWERYAETERERYVAEAEMPRLKDAIDAEPSPYVRALLWLYLLTGMRRTELRTITWPDVDLDAGLLRLRTTKAGRPHYVPLTTHAVELLRALPRHAGNPHVFVGKLPGKPMNSANNVWERVRTRAGLGDVWIHDLRRTLGSWLSNSGTSLQIVGRALNHTSEKTTRRYARLQVGPVARKMETHQARLFEAASPGVGVRRRRRRRGAPVRPRARQAPAEAVTLN